MSELRANPEVFLPHQRATPLRRLHQVRGHGRFPVLPRTYIPRPRLWRQLDAATQGGGITLLVAAAGAGKTLGVAGWLLEHRRDPNASWVSRAGDLTEKQLASLLTPDGTGSPAPLVVIDDAHELSRACVRWLDDVLQEEPERLRLVLLSRWDLPFTRLVPELLGHLTVLRGDLCRLSRSETADLVAAHVGDASDELVDIIASHAEGWCAAVVLIARTVARSPAPLPTARSAAENFSAVDRVAREAFAALTSRQRHVLLCVAQEDVVTPSLARHLTNDSTADRVLEELEETGLLVTRHISLGSARAENAVPQLHLGTADEEDRVTYRVHPLLAEVARRRMHSGGVDVERARATVRRAVDLDVSRGELRHSLHRLMGVGDHERVVDLLADHGVPLLLSGDARAVRSFEIEHPDLIEARPACWFTIALERWQSGPDSRARYWLHRVAAAARGKESEKHPFSTLGVASAHLMLALLGEESLAAAAEAARAQLDEPTGRGTDRSPDLALLQLLLGMAELRLGDLERAQQSLSTVALRGNTLEVKALHDGALAQLAVSEFLRGREHVALMLAGSVSESPSDTPLGGGLTLAAELSRLQSTTDTGQDPGAAGRPVIDLHGEDMIIRFLALLLESRRFLLHGNTTDAAGVVDGSLEAADLPDSLHASLLTEQALHAALCLDRARLKNLEGQLRAEGAHGEAAFVAGLRADVVDDLPAAVTEFSFAAEHAHCKQPAVSAIAATCLAQLLDAQGHGDAALGALEVAAVETASRRNVLPFLGWTRHGTPVPRLLDALAHTRPSPWTEELAAWSAQRSSWSVTGQAGPVTATPQERELVTTGGVRLALTSRERDVLHELARGSTYAGIARNLFVSENTVKTHVSSLYAKLGVGRRSDALAVARTMRML